MDRVGYLGRGGLCCHRRPHEPARSQPISRLVRQTDRLVLAASIFYCVTAIGVAWPSDGKQMAMFIILFVMVGWMAMGLLFSFASIRWGLTITALALIGYFFLSDIFYLWMAILGGGGMIALGLHIRNRW